MSNTNPSSFKGYRIAISILLVLAAVCTIAVAVLGCFGILFELELWLVVTLAVFGVLVLVLWCWFLCVSAKIAKNAQKKA